MVEVLRAHGVWLVYEIKSMWITNSNRNNICAAISTPKIYINDFPISFVYPSYLIFVPNCKSRLE